MVSTLQVPTLQVRDLTVRFGGLVAVDRLSLEAGRGELVAVVGPNGAGKSTLFQLISGVIPPDAGSARLEGLELAGKPPEVIAALGVARTFQTSRVFGGMSIWDSVRIGLHPSLTRGAGPLRELWQALVRPRAFAQRERDLDARAEAVLKLFGERLWPRRDQPAWSLSYANRRRLEIARALVAEPKLLLLDEPTAGMNPTETAELAQLIERLRRERPEMTILLVEHKLEMVRSLADRVVVMDQGRKVVEGAPQEALSDPRVLDAYLGRRRNHGEGARHQPVRAPAPAAASVAPAAAPAAAQAAPSLNDGAAPAVEVAGR